MKNFTETYEQMISNQGGAKKGAHTVRTLGGGALYKTTYLVDWTNLAGESVNLLFTSRTPAQRFADHLSAL